jgi:hypothetical protein
MPDQTTSSDYSKAMKLFATATYDQVSEAFEILIASAPVDAFYALNKVIADD